MRDYAIDVLRDSVAPSVEPAAAKAPAASTGPLNPFAFAIPIFLVGAVLTPLFPPLGLTLAGFGIIVCLGGLGIAIARSLWSRVAALRARSGK